MSDLIDAGSILDSGPRSSAYDSLAELFLGEPPVAAPPPSPNASKAPQQRTMRHTYPIEPAAQPPSSASVPAAVSVEGLILGHLPVLATAWAAQYARHVAATLGGPVALLRLRAGEAVLDITGDLPQTEVPAQSLDDAVLAAAPRVVAWLIRVDEISEPRLIDQWGLDSVTLLTGTDEMAIVSAYRTIKQLFKPGDEEAAGPAIRIAIMGATAKRAAEASSKLERAACAFVGRSVSVVGCIAKISGGRTSTLYRGSPGGSTEEALGRVIPVIRSMPRPAAARPYANAPAIESIEPDIDVSPSHAEPAAASTQETVRVAPSASAPVSRLGHTVNTAIERAVRPHLAPYISGLTALEARCPHAPRVELATDSTGVLHALARTGDGLTYTDAAAQLISAGAWAALHHDLLRLAAKAEGVRLDKSPKPTLHLLTDDPKAVRHMGDAEFRLHLLARVEVAGHAGWYCTELN